MQKIFLFFKPFLPIILIITLLQLTGQLGNVASYGQGMILKTGILNADGEAIELEEGEEGELFNYDLNAYGMDGKPLSMDALKNKVVFLNMWATWCGPCRAEMPTIQNLYQSIDNKDVVFVMLSVDRKDPDKKVKDYIASNEFSFPVYILSGQPSEQLRVPTIPTTFVIGKSGKIVRKEVGMKNYDTEKFRKFLLKEAEAK